MLLPMLFSILAGDGQALAFAGPALAALVTGGLLFFPARARRGSRGSTYVSGRDVYLIVVLGWLGVATFGSVPFVLSGLMGPADAFFESMAGFTATQLYSAEAADPVPERLTARIRDTAKILAFVYLGLTLGGVVALSLAGMGLFDAVNHALTTVSTGGFSTRADSIAAFDSAAIEFFVAAGMILSGANFALYFQAARGRLGRALGNAELIVYLSLVAFGTLVTTTVLYVDGGSMGRSLLDGLFQSASLSTGTGFVTADWKSWGSLSQGVLLLLMAIGPCAGSTGGGMKVVRVMLLARHAWQEVFRMLHPQAVTLLKFGDRVIPERLRMAFLGFFFIYIAALAVGTLIMALYGLPLGEAFGSVFSCLSITGVALGPVGDASFFADLPASAKVILTGYMLLGRLELFTVLVILTPEFWRR
jgi:trk system potassium uptake protein TrkH